MTQGINNTTTENFRRLFGNGLNFRIPKYQRDYSWDSEQWSDLWYDLQQAREKKETHYMGYLVLQTDNDKEFYVIDGQQRLTTVSILILAAIKTLQETGNDGKERSDNLKRAEAIQAAFIGNKNPLTLKVTNKLELNVNNNDFFQRYLAPLESFPKRGITASQRLMKGAFEYFYGEIKGVFKTAEEIVLYVESIVDTMYFTVLTVSDELNAFKVFETLNARGVQLSSSDLLKNRLFSIVADSGTHKAEMDELEYLWSKVIGKLEGYQFSEYLRIYWNSTHKIVRKNELYKAIRDSVKTRQEAFELLRELLRMSDVFFALQKPDDDFWESNKQITKDLKWLNLFNITQPLSLLLVAYDTLNIKDFERLLSAIVKISFRYNIICGKNPNEQESVYNTVALDISLHKDLKLQKLKDIYIDDDEFEQSFSTKQFKNIGRNNRLARYILAEIDSYNSNTVHDPDGLTLEHILPESPDPDVWKLDDDTVSQWKYRIGNLTLLDKKTNKDIGNESFIDKKQYYAKSAIPMTKEIGESEYTEWNTQQIRLRQEKLAKSAKAIWRIW
jgi:uncharacterized protein with ParB-like and HNH nuclease domain